MSNLCHKCFYEYDTPGSCPRCGYDATAELGKYPLALRPGSILGGRYIVGRVLGEGGFGITYSAQDYDSKDLVAIKEHFPAAIVTRTGHSYISLISESMKDAFLEGKQKFLDEAKTLSQFNGLDNICDIYSYFEENGTAYFAMEYVNGIALDDYIKRLGRLPSFEEATRLMLPVMDALSHVHEKGIIHRDISPDNIMVTPDGKVMLIDFGAARYSMGEKSRSLDVILKHGFAPREQYNRHSRQGAYTDVYAMAATYYYVLTGKVPQDALDRLDDDRLELPTKLGIKIPRRAEQALMKALAVNFNQRWQSMREFSEIIRKELPPSKAELEAKRRAEEERRAAERKAKEEEKAREAEKRAEAQRLKELKKAEKAQKTAASESPKKKKPLALIAAIAAIAIGAGAFFAMGGDRAESPAVSVSDAPVIVSEASAPTEEPENITWKLSEGSKTLTISGEGEMEDYWFSANQSTAPWHAEKDLIERVIISDGITAIGGNAFIECSSLREVIIPNSVKIIGQNAFSFCSSLESVKIPNSVLYIQDYAFANCRALGSISLPVGLRNIGNYAFFACDSLTTVHFSGTQEQWDDIVIMNYKNCNDPLFKANIVFLIAGGDCGGNLSWSLSGDGTLTISGEGEMEDYFPSFPPWFEMRDSITRLVINEGITKIGCRCFRELPCLEEVVLPRGLTSIGESAFRACKELRSVYFPEGLKEIGQAAFEVCSSLEDISLPSSLKRINANAFNIYGSNLHKIIFRGSEEQWNKIFIAGYVQDFHSETFYIAEKFFCEKSGNAGQHLSWALAEDGTLYIIGDGAMEHYASAQDAPWYEFREEILSINIEQGITSISENAFSSLNARSVRIPNTVKSIGTAAFSDCEQLGNILFQGSWDSWNSCDIANNNDALKAADLTFVS